MGFLGVGNALGRSGWTGMGTGRDETRPHRGRWRPSKTTLEGIVAAGEAAEPAKIVTKGPYRRI